MTHTPGPWKAKNIAGQIYIGSEDDSNECVFDRQIADMVQSKARGTRQIKQVEADARLIAAAPEMLAALQQVEAEMRAGFGSSFGQTREQVRRAIAKAAGR